MGMANDDRRMRRPHLRFPPGLSISPLLSYHPPPSNHLAPLSPSQPPSNQSVGTSQIAEVDRGGRNGETREMRREREEKSREEEAMKGDGDPGESRAGGGSAIAHAASGALADGETPMGGPGEAQAGGTRQAAQAGGETNGGEPCEAQAGGERQVARAGGETDMAEPGEAQACGEQQAARAGGETDMGEPGEAQAGGEQQATQADGETDGGEPDGGEDYGSVLNNTAAIAGGIGGHVGGYLSPVVWSDIFGGLLWSDNSRNRQTYLGVMYASCTSRVRRKRLPSACVASTTALASALSASLRQPPLPP